VREALWREPDAFSTTNDFYLLIKELSDLRDAQPCLRYGRQYFRQCSGNSSDFGYSTYPGGLIAFSRILNDIELLVVVDTSTTYQISVFLVVDINLNPDGRPWTILFSSELAPVAPEPTSTHSANRTVKVSLARMEAQVIG